MKGVVRFPRSLRLGMVAIIVGGGLLGCVRQGPPAPIDDRGGMFFGRGTAVPVARPAAERPQPTAGTVVPPLVSKPGVVTVQTGDTLYGISRRNNVPIRAIINANNLTPPYSLPIGRQLVLPQQPYHRVAPGETVATISRAYNVSTQDLVRTNGIEPPYLIYVGQPILLPLPTTGVASSAPATASPSLGASPSAVQPANPSVANVEPSNVEPSAAPGSPVPSASAPATIGEAPPPPSQANPGPGSPGSGPPDAMPQDSVASLPPPSAPAEAPISAPPGAFIWPVQGNVLSAFGAKPGGLVNDGINISAPIGTPVRASQDGTVAYAGNELRGYGNLLLVRHDNGWVTAYAHNSEILVARGARVKRGQIISRVGASGSVSEPQLHFEIRQGTRSVDPTRYLSGQGISGRS